MTRISKMLKHINHSIKSISGGESNPGPLTFSGGKSKLQQWWSLRSRPIASFIFALLELISNTYVEIWGDPIKTFSSDDFVDL